ncbi:MAG: hypothetical protein A2002_05405 [Pseudomonadales bacterium GWC1_66_9]|nr:MAG: hypothetical protein A2002_05405 [Pseudomonadales bacterium GWC1_66_9]
MPPGTQRPALKRGNPRACPSAQRNAVQQDQPVLVNVALAGHVAAQRGVGPGDAQALERATLHHVVEAQAAGRQRQGVGQAKEVLLVEVLQARIVVLQQGLLPIR